MKVMLIEDNAHKRDQIAAHLYERGIAQKDIIFVENLTGFFANLRPDIGLFIIDIRIPSVDQAAAAQNGKVIVETLVKIGRTDALLLAISSYPEDFDHLRLYFEMHGCILCY